MQDTNEFDFSQFFELSNPWATQYFEIATEGDGMGFSQVWELFKGERQLSEPIRIKACKGGMPADFLWAGAFAPLVCVSHRVVEILVNNQLTGWATYPVEIYDRRGVLLPGYHGLAIKSFAGDRDLNRSPIITKSPIVLGGKPPRVYKGVFFGENQWDGSDVFRVSAGIKVVTRRVQNAFKFAKINNVRLTPITEVETDLSVYWTSEGYRR